MYGLFNNFTNPYWEATKTLPSEDLIVGYPTRYLAGESPNWAPRYAHLF
jgi:hypothetical protein